MSKTKVHPFLRGMTDAHIAKLKQLALYAEYRPGDVILREGAPADALFLIDEGKVSLETNADGEGLIQVQQLGKGDVLGWSWLYSPYIWHFSGRAVQRTTGHWYDGKILRDLCAREHDFGYELMRRVSEVVLNRLQNTRRELVRLYRARAKTKK